jgi:hypothetical protein
MAYTDSSGSGPNGIMVVDLDTGDVLGGVVYDSAGASLTIEGQGRRLQREQFHSSPTAGQLAVRRS